MTVLQITSSHTAFHTSRHCLDATLSLNTHEVTVLTSAHYLSFTRLHAIQRNFHPPSDSTLVPLSRSLWGSKWTLSADPRAVSSYEVNGRLSSLDPAPGKACLSNISWRLQVRLEVLIFDPLVLTIAL